MRTKNDVEVLSIYDEVKLLERSLVKVGELKKMPILFSESLYNSGFTDIYARKGIVYRALRSLTVPDSEDSDEMRVRRLKADNAVVVYDSVSIVIKRHEKN